ncbi:MAG: response regulator [Chloroflexales bacterium]|nr:response regulator [Chloroflexales bacterium]
MPSRRIAIVDNDPTAALVTQRGLQKLLNGDVKVTVAPSPNAAWMDCLNEEVDLVIVDPSPQGGAATSLVRVLRRYRPQIPVLVLTAYDSPGLRKQMRTFGVESYLAKPVDLRDLGQTVRTVLREAPLQQAVLHQLRSANNAA